MENTRDRIIQDNTKELCEACRDGNIKVVEEILSNKEVDINGRYYYGGTPLTCAVRCGHLNIVSRLLQHPGVDVNAPDYAGDTPLMCAVTWGYLDIVRTLLEVPALQLGRCDNNGATALHCVTGKNRISIMKLLCQDSRCSPGVVNKKTSDRYGATALMKAVCWGYLDIVKELDRDREGTDFSTVDRRGTTLIQMARRIVGKTRGNYYAAVLKYLRKRPKVDTLQVIAAHNIARYVRNKADVEALEIPVTVKHFLAGFVIEDTDDQAGAELSQAQARLSKLQLFLIRHRL